MANLPAQVQAQARAARSELDALLRTPLVRSQVDDLRADRVSEHHVSIIYPFTPETYPAQISALLAEPGGTWLHRELARLDPTAYCLHLPQATYQRLSGELPPLPETRPYAPGELAYLAAFISHLAAEDFALPAADFARGVTTAEVYRWQHLLAQVSGLRRALRTMCAQQSATGRLTNRLRSLFH